MQSFDKSKWKVYNWKHISMLHWMLNPGLVINELLFGQRVPKISLLDKESGEPRSKRTYIPCPHCNTFHDSRTWSTTNNTAFGNWFGLYCRNCKKIIPCLWNLTSLLILLITAPIWIWFYKSWREKWLFKQEERFKDIDINSVPNPYEGLGWIKEGISWGFLMYVFMTFVFPWVENEPLAMKKVLISIPIWLIGGLGFGYSMKKFFNQRGENKKEIE